MAANSNDADDTSKHVFKKSAREKKGESYENTILRNEKREAKKELQRRNAVERGQRPKPPPPPIQKRISIQIMKATHIFGINHTSLSKDIIKEKYKELALRNHPDKGGSTEHFIQIKHAYDILLAHCDNEP
jgi:hypothetical protein